MNDHILIRYGELSLKKSNRNQFIKKINNHIERALKTFSKLTFEARGLRFYIILNGVNNTSGLILDGNGSENSAPIFFQNFTASGKASP